MKNIALLFRDDLKRATRNVISMIVLFGVVVIPSFFAWFNVISSWDPFADVKNLKVAVANADEGFESDLFPMRVNIGAEVITKLRDNTDLNWIFVTEKEAIDGTTSGEYYAALVLPADFSRAMMTFFVPGSTPTQIEYYTNEKENALSPKITGEAATDVSTQINASFTKTLNDVGFSVISAISKNLGDADAQGAVVRLQASVDQLATQLHAGATSAEMFGSLIASSETILNSAASLTAASASAFHDAGGTIGRGAVAARELGATLDRTVESLATALSASAQSYQRLADRVRQVYGSLDGQVTEAVALLDALGARVDAQIGDYQTLRDDLRAQADATADPVVRDALNLVVSRLDAVIVRQQALRDRIEAAAAALAAGNTDSQAARDEITALADQAKAAIESARDAYAAELKPTLERLAATASTIDSSFRSLGGDLAGVGARLSDGSGPLLGGITLAAGTMDAVAIALDASATQFDRLAAALDTATTTGDLSEVTALIGSNPAILATALAQPVKLKTIPVFAVDTFGAQMAPFYTVLGLWIGALLLSVLIRVDVPRDSLPVTSPLTRTQEYFGRYGFFALLAFLQSSLLYIGLIWFVGVQPVYPMLLILAGWVMSLVFVLLTYTLVVSFGELGKAVGVFLLVIQISSGGGAYPLAVLPDWFQNISPFVPVTHATNAVRSAIAGIYEGDYWISLAWLAAFIVPALLLGLVLRLPLIRFNDDLGKALEGTKLM